VPDSATLILSHSDVRSLLSMQECIGVMEDALRALARGDAMLPLRTVVRLPGGNSAFATMPALLEKAIGAKVITVFPENDSTPYDSHIGVVLYFDDVNGRLLSILDASSITAIRTAAVSGLATRLLANTDAGDLAILGTGVQARTHLEAMRSVRPIRRVRVWSRSSENRERFVASVSAPGLEVVACESAHEAVTGAEIICTTTSARIPVLLGEWIAPGTHVNAVGASVATARELDTAAVTKSKLYVDREESIMKEGGLFLLAREEGAIDNSHIVGELGELLIGEIPGRGDHGEITLFQSVGLAVEDVACARFLFEKAGRLGGGTRVDIGGMRGD
jgi:ornithine cyclodeaminase/alanine dehydrogenase-like protein (mu-crystallin family)